MKKYIGLLILALAFTSCKESIRGNGVVKKDERAVKSFDELDVSGQFNVFLRQGDTEQLIVEADENFLPYIKSDVHGDRLVISAEANFKSYEKLAVYVTVRELSKIDISGSIDLDGSQTIRSDELEINASGACETDLELQCEELGVDGSGSIELNLIGFASEARYDLSGAVEINAIDLETRRTLIDMSGAGRADVFVTDELEIDVSGAAEINYRGNPRELKQNISGAADINQLKN